jgi:hypothetical protein
MPKNNLTAINPVSEADVEAILVERVEALGGACEKTVCPGSRGYFDRVAVLPGSPARVIFLEVKRPKGGRVAKHQAARHALYRSLGAEVAVIKRIADIDRLLG